MAESEVTKPAVTSIQRIKNNIELSKKFMEDEYEGWYDNYWDLYENRQSGRKLTLTDSKSDEILWINEFYPNVELMKSSISFKNPRVFVRGKTPDSQPKAQLVADILNWLNYEINTKSTFDKIRDDAIISNFGVGMLSYNPDIGIGVTPDDIYVKDDNIAWTYIYPKDFGVDPECTDAYEFTDAKYCKRTVVMPLDWVKANDNFKNTDGLKASSIMSGTQAGGSKLLESISDKSYHDSDEVKRVVLHEYWEKPTPKERLENKKGRVYVVAEGHDKILREQEWPYEMEGYPFSGIRLNDRNDRFYVEPDFGQYKEQVEEKSLLRTYQLQNAHISGNIHLVYDTNLVDETTKRALLSGMPNAIGTNGDINAAARFFSAGSASQEFYLVDQKVSQDMDNLSGMNDLKRGVMTKGASATEASIADRSSNARFVTRLNKFADFYVRVQRKMIQLAQQFFDIEKVFRIVNDPARVAEWAKFTRQDIQGEFDIRVQVQEMTPTSRETEVAKILNVVKLITESTNSPFIMQRLNSEGLEINLSGVFLELQHLMDLESLQIIRKLSPQEMQQKQAMNTQAMNGEGVGGVGGAQGAGGQGVDLGFNETLRQSQANQLGNNFRGAA